MMRRGSVLAVAGFALLGSACRRGRATEADCTAILDRVVLLELRERGFHDPALAQRKTAELRRTLGDLIGSCPGRHMRKGALACVQDAGSVEEITHGCLR